VENSPVKTIANLSADDRRNMLDSTHGLDRIMLLLIFETGLDVEDLIKLRVSDVDVEGRFIQLPGGERLNLSPQAEEELKGYLKGYLSTRSSQAFLFEGRCGKPITVKWKRCVLDKLLQARPKGQN
jgi:integrase